MIWLDGRVEWEGTGGPGTCSMMMNEAPAKAHVSLEVSSSIKVKSGTETGLRMTSERRIFPYRPSHSKKEMGKTIISVVSPTTLK